MTPSRPAQDRLTGEPTASERIGKSWYDESDYIQSATYLHDFASSFQRYRLRKVLAIHAISSEDRVLDMGCGWGTMTYGIARKAREVVGLDFSQRAVDHCNAFLARTRARNVEFRVGDACDTGLLARSFDVVVAADLFEHLYPDDSEAVSAEAFRVLKPAGRFLVWTPCSSHFLEVLRNNAVVLKRDPSHVDYKSMARMTALLANAGFEIDRAYYTESHLPGLRLLERLGQRFVPLLRRRIAVLGRKPTLNCDTSGGGGGRTACPDRLTRMPGSAAPVPASMYDTCSHVSPPSVAHRAHRVANRARDGGPSGSARPCRARRTTELATREASRRAFAGLGS